jgi:hypothetical protein
MLSSARKPKITRVARLRCWKLDVDNSHSTPFFSLYKPDFLSSSSVSILQRWFHTCIAYDEHGHISIQLFVFDAESTEMSHQVQLGLRIVSNPK